MKHIKQWLRKDIKSLIVFNQIMAILFEKKGNIASPKILYELFYVIYLQAFSYTLVGGETVCDGYLLGFLLCFQHHEAITADGEARGER